MENEEFCESACESGQRVSRLKELVEEQNVPEVANIFKAVADVTRLKIAYALLLEKELCVCDAAEIIGSSSATASHHLRMLGKLGLAKHRKEGKQVYYSLDDDHVKALIDIAFTHQKEVMERE
ncbi:ArsR/SmtB family transcription factor [Peribacillus sp. SCS-26]|uniref:ArsR/SmtB family transcription factor n=1 Tax=Paraperibacillus marinus TaxID=3115295 RepID=UPI003905C744